MALVVLEALRPAEIPDTVEVTDIAEPTGISDIPGLEPVAVRSSQAVAASGQCTVPRRRMANRPARPGHHQNMHPLPDLPAD